MMGSLVVRLLGLVLGYGVLHRLEDMREKGRGGRGVSINVSFSLLKGKWSDRVRECLPTILSATVSRCSSS